MKNPQEVDAAFQLAAAEGHGVLIEELVPGKDYRLTVIGGKFAAALMCVPPQVRGDGVHTIRQLIDELNAEPDRDKLRFSPITFDHELEDHLDALGYRARFDTSTWPAYCGPSDWACIERRHSD